MTNTKETTAFLRRLVVVSFIFIVKMKKKIKEAVLQASVNELRFANLQNLLLLQALHEIETVTNDPIVKSIVKLTIERHNLDKIIHARKLLEEKYLR